ncbi:MAG: MarR family transcriptional regulator [bacterium]|nr:MarR family transcriptional regulator [bacterium]
MKKKYLGYLINKTALKMKNNLNNRLKENGFNITADQFAILNIINNNNGLTQSEIANIIEKDKTGITRILDSMEKNDFIKRKKHETDRRAYCIFITDHGKKTREEADIFIQNMTSVLIKNFGQKKHDELIRLLSVLHDTLE